MTVRLKHRSPRDEAEEVVNANLKPMMEEILRNVGGRMRAAGKPLNRQDLEVAYNEGWQGVTEHIIQGRPVTSLAGLLFTMVHRRAIDIYRAKQEGRRVEMDLEAQPVDAEIAEHIDDQEMLTRLLGRLKDRLNDKERRAVTLCALHGYKRPEAADLLGIDRVVFERIMDSASKKMAGIVASLEARGCGGEEWSRMMRAYALGLLTEDEPDYQRALAHVDGPSACEACRRYVRGLRGLAAVLPPLLPPGLLDGHDAASTLQHLVRWLGGGHTTAAVQGAGAAGAGAAGVSTGGGTAVGVAVGGGTKALLIAGAAALSIAGAAAVVVTKPIGGSPSHHSAQTGRPSPAGDLNQNEALALPSLFSSKPAKHTTGTVGHHRPAADRRRGAVAEFASGHPSVARENRKPEFTWEQPPGDRTRQAARTATTPASTPPRAEATQHSPEEPAEFRFEK
jgi:DNA-directed RNA polymerase specialized sigma24 family protein